MNLKRYFTFDTSDGNYDEIKTKKILRTLYKGVKIPWGRIIIGAFLAVFNVLVLFTQYENYMMLYQGTLTSLKPLWMYITASFIQYILIFISVIYDRAMVDLTTGVGKKLWNKMMKLPVRDFETSKPGGMLSRITLDALYASRPFEAVMAFLQLVVAILSLSAAVPENITYAYPMLFISLMGAIGLTFYAARVLSKSTLYAQNKKSEQTDNYNEMFANIRFIKASNCEEKVIEKSDAFIEKRYNAALYSAFYQGLLQLINNYSYLAMILCFVAGIFCINAGTLKETEPLNAAYTFLFAIVSVTQAIMVFPTYFSEAIGGTRKIATVLHKEEEDVNVGDELNTLGDIKLENVDFAYGQRNTLKNINVEIPANKTTAIVGINGSGKSTLIKMIDRLYLAKSGEIYLGDNIGSKISLKSWRSKFAVVSQKTALFSGTIKDNICYGVENVSDEEVLKAVEIAGLKELVDEKGLDYDVGVAGNKLSGGEAQRVSIARALIKNPEYLILDEATANLDTRTENLVRDGINELMKGRTTIIIAHDYETIEKADNVIVMRDGKVEDYGEKDEMIKRNPFMKMMVGA